MNSLTHTLTRTGDEPDPVVEAVERPASLAEAYDTYAARVYRYLLYRVRNAKEAENLTSQVFLDVLRGLPGYTPRTPFAAWLFTIVRRRAADHYRRRKPLLPLEEKEARLPAVEDPLAQVIRAENLERLVGQVARLSPDEQELLRLRFSAELSFAEMGALLGQKADAVKKAVYRLLARLERQMEAEDA